MPKYRENLPQLNGKMFLTDGGLETTLIFHERIDLPHFAAFDLLKSTDGRNSLAKYFRTYAAIAREFEVGFILESATWRASSDWGKKLGYSADTLSAANQDSIELLVAIRKEFEADRSPMVISGCVGPRGDGYNVEARMSDEEAEEYHSEQIASFASTEADMVTAITMTHVAEAVGLTRAAVRLNMPVVISFTVETDGVLPSGELLSKAIQEVDAETECGPAYYMINCAHPTHFSEILKPGEGWVNRIRGLRANASAKSHAELDEATELDDGHPAEFGEQHAALCKRFGQLNVLGGCCGTDDRHVTEIAKAIR